VASVSVRRVLPGAFEVNIVERAPHFWRRRGDALFYADERGEIIAPVQAGERFMPLPLVIEEAGMPDQGDRLSQLAVLGDDAELPFRLETASWIKMRGLDGVELYFDDRGCRVSLGLDEWDANIQRLKLVWEDLERRGELDWVSDIGVQGSNVWVVRSPQVTGAEAAT